MARKKSKTGRWIILVTIIATVLFALVLGVLWYDSNTNERIRYPAFGISIPAGFEIHGIDVSKYQQTIAWSSVREMEVNGIRVHFAFIKATEGTANYDAQFKRNWRKSREAGIIRGAYHFFVPSRDGKLQARNFINRVELESGDLPPVLDIEQLGNVSLTTLRMELDEWLKTIEGYYGVKPIIYTNADFWEKNLKGHFDEYPLWVAHYLQPNNPRISRQWSFWQHSETGRVNGIRSKVDFNVFNGDSIAFRDLLVP